MLRSQITQQNTSEYMLMICIDRRNLGRMIWNSFFYLWLLNSTCSKIRLDKTYYCDIGYVVVSMYGALRLFTC